MEPDDLRFYVIETTLNNWETNQRLVCGPETKEDAEETMKELSENNPGTLYQLAEVQNAR